MKQKTNKIISAINERDGEVFGFFFTRAGYEYKDFIVVPKEAFNGSPDEIRAVIRELAELMGAKLNSMAQSEYTGENEEERIKERSRKLLEDIE
jgi:TRAP-type C4-dicarboxylate transport system substrate-binding protein